MPLLGLVSGLGPGRLGSLGGQVPGAPRTRWPLLVSATQAEASGYQNTGGKTSELSLLSANGLAVLDRSIYFRLTDIAFIHGGPYLLGRPAIL